MKLWRKISYTTRDNLFANILRNYATIRKILIKNWVCRAKPKLAKFPLSKSFMDELVELSRKLKKTYIYNIYYMGFRFRLQSHSATIKKIYLRYIYNICLRDNLTSSSIDFCNLIFEFIFFYFDTNPEFPIYLSFLVCRIIQQVPP